MVNYIYCFIRTDIPFVQRIVQIGHVCYEAGKLFQDQLGISHMILLSAKDEEDIKSISKQLDGRGIDYVSFYEPDINSYTSICTIPISDKCNYFSKFNRYE